MKASERDPYGLKTLQQARSAALEMGGPERVARQHARGRLTARERIDRLLDDDTFEEVGLLARSDLPDARDKSPADGKVTGFGKVEGRTVYVFADDVTVFAGAGGRVGTAKAHHGTRYAAKKGYPCISLGDAGGARIPDIMGAIGQMTMVYDIRGEPRDRRVPYIATIMGECYGSPTWRASEADIVVMVKGAAMAVSGPSVLEIATGERVTAEDLGGWELHATETGQVDLFADDEEHCLGLVRQVLGYLPSSAEDLPPRAESGDDPERRLDDILDVVPREANRAYDMHRVLERVFDSGSLLELKPFFDPSLITALARLDGHVVGVLANNPRESAGAMGPGACEKATAFICLCDSFHIPLIFLHDTPGFFVSKAAEERKMPLRIIQFMNAIQHSTVPRLAVIIRKSYGMAHCNMIGANMGADYLAAWPTADVSFMAPAVGVNVVYGRALAAEDDPEAARRAYLEEMAKMNAPWDAAAANMVDDIIDPRDTRWELVAALRRAIGSDGDRGRSQRLLASWPTGF